MKKIIMCLTGVLILTVSTITVTLLLNYQVPVEHQEALASSGCTIDTLYPDATDCTRFYMCAPYGLQLFSCPSGLHFNPSANYCDWPNAAGCAVVTTQETLYASTNRELFNNTDSEDNEDVDLILSVTQSADQKQAVTEVEILNQLSEELTEDNMIIEELPKVTYASAHKYTTPPNEDFNNEQRKSTDFDSHEIPITEISIISTVSSSIPSTIFVAYSSTKEKSIDNPTTAEEQHDAISFGTTSSTKNHNTGISNTNNLITKGDLSSPVTDQFSINELTSSNEINFQSEKTNLVEIDSHMESTSNVFKTSVESTVKNNLFSETTPSSQVYNSIINSDILKQMDESISDLYFTTPSNSELNPETGENYVTTQKLQTAITTTGPLTTNSGKTVPNKDALSTSHTNSVNFFNLKETTQISLEDTPILTEETDKGISSTTLEYSHSTEQNDFRISKPQNLLATTLSMPSAMEVSSEETLNTNIYTNEIMENYITTEEFSDKLTVITSPTNTKDSKQFTIVNALDETTTKSEDFASSQSVSENFDVTQEITSINPLAIPLTTMKDSFPNIVEYITKTTESYVTKANTPISSKVQDLSETKDSSILPDFTILSEEYDIANTTNLVEFAIDESINENTSHLNASSDIFYVKGTTVTTEITSTTVEEKLNNSIIAHENVETTDNLLNDNDVEDIVTNTQHILSVDATILTTDITNAGMKINDSSSPSSHNNQSDSLYKTTVSLGDSSKITQSTEFSLSTSYTSGPKMVSSEGTTEIATLESQLQQDSTLSNEQQEHSPNKNPSYSQTLHINAEEFLTPTTIFPEENISPILDIISANTEITNSVTVSSEESLNSNKITESLLNTELSNLEIVHSSVGNSLTPETNNFPDSTSLVENINNKESQITPFTSFEVSYSGPEIESSVNDISANSTTKVNTKAMNNEQFSTISQTANEKTTKMFISEDTTEDVFLELQTQHDSTVTNEQYTLNKNSPHSYESQTSHINREELVIQTTPLSSDSYSVTYPEGHISPILDIISPNTKIPSSFTVSSEESLKNQITESLLSNTKLPILEIENSSVENFVIPNNIPDSNTFPLEAIDIKESQITSSTYSVSYPVPVTESSVNKNQNATSTTKLNTIAIYPEQFSTSLQMTDEITSYTQPEINFSFNEAEVTFKESVTEAHDLTNSSSSQVSVTVSTVSTDDQSIAVSSESIVTAGVEENEGNQIGSAALSQSVSESIQAPTGIKLYDILRSTSTIPTSDNSDIITEKISYSESSATKTVDGTGTGNTDPILQVISNKIPSLSTTQISMKNTEATQTTTLPSADSALELSFNDGSTSNQEASGSHISKLEMLSKPSMYSSTVSFETKNSDQMSTTASVENTAAKISVKYTTGEETVTDTLTQVEVSSTQKEFLVSSPTLVKTTPDNKDIPVTESMTTQNAYHQTATFNTDALRVTINNILTITSNNLVNMENISGTKVSEDDGLTNLETTTSSNYELNLQNENIFNVSATTDVILSLNDLTVTNNSISITEHIEKNELNNDNIFNPHSNYNENTESGILNTKSTYSETIFATELEDIVLSDLNVITDKVTNSNVTENILTNNNSISSEISNDHNIEPYKEDNVTQDSSSLSEGITENNKLETNSEITANRLQFTKVTPTIPVEHSGVTSETTLINNKSTNFYIQINFSITEKDGTVQNILENIIDKGIEAIKNVSENNNDNRDENNDKYNYDYDDKVEDDNGDDNKEEDGHQGGHKHHDNEDKNKNDDEDGDEDDDEDGDEDRDEDEEREDEEGKDKDNEGEGDDNEDEDEDGEKEEEQNRHHHNNKHHHHKKSKENYNSHYKSKESSRNNNPHNNHSDKNDNNTNKKNINTNSENNESNIAENIFSENSNQDNNNQHKLSNRRRNKRNSDNSFAQTRRDNNKRQKRNRATKQMDLEVFYKIIKKYKKTVRWF